jgi:hypothetical protein
MGHELDQTFGVYAPTSLREIKAFLFQVNYTQPRVGALAQFLLGHKSWSFPDPERAGWAIAGDGTITTNQTPALTWLQ